MQTHRYINTLKGNIRKAIREASPHVRIEVLRKICEEELEAVERFVLSLKDKIEKEK